MKLTEYRNLSECDIYFEKKLYTILQSQCWETSS